MPSVCVCVCSGRCTKWPWLPTSPEDGRPDLSVSVMWALSDFTCKNGATRFVPGSNRWPRAGTSYGAVGATLPDGIVDGRDTVQAEMGTGSVVLWVGGTLHGASSHAPRTPDEAADAHSARRGLLFIYNLGCALVRTRTQVEPGAARVPKSTRVFACRVRQTCARSITSTLRSRSR